jgi:2-methylcitrate dehydratase PrpD
MSDYLAELARWVEAVHWQTLPPSTLAATKLVLLDTLGAMLAGSCLAENTRLAELAAARSSRPSATLIGHGLRADAAWAALSNATAGVALEVDEGNRLGGGHPAIHVIPGALGFAEEQALDGPRVLESIVAGYEVGSRLGGATTARPNVHSHGTWGTISTAVAVTKLAALPAAGIGDIINLSASMSPANTWTPALGGATIRNLYPGRAAVEGILAVDLHRCGFTGLSDGPADVYGTVLGERFEPALAVDGLGDSYRIEQNYFKFHACCRYNHYALEALAALQRRHQITADLVDTVSVTTIPFGLRMADSAPATTLAAKFSIPYAVSAALVLGTADVSAFLPTSLADPRIRALATRVRVEADSEMSPRRLDYPTARVRVAFRDGRVLEGSATIPPGDAANPVPRSDVVSKFVALAEPVVGGPRVRRLLEVVEELEAVKDIRDLTALLTPG